MNTRHLVADRRSGSVTTSLTPMLGSNTGATLNPSPSH
jgi:hypothetical protein